MNEWRRIETAPKDGTPILAWDGDAMACVEYHQVRHGSSFWELGHSSDGVLFMLRHPTHWMPLPEPPE